MIKNSFSYFPFLRLAVQFLSTPASQCYNVNRTKNAQRMPKLRCSNAEWEEEKEVQDTLSIKKGGSGGGGVACVCVFVIVMFDVRELFVAVHLMECKT